MNAARIAVSSSPAHYVAPPAQDPMFHNVPLSSSAQPGIPPLNGDENQNVLTLYPHLATLTAIQARALSLLLQGHSVTAAARRLGLERHTVSRWRNHHPAFVAELNRQQQELLSQTAVLCHRAVRKSFKRIHAALNKTDSPESLQVAMAIARSSLAHQIAVIREPAPTDAIAVVNAMAAREQRLVGDTYQDSYVHQDMAHRLARLDLEPNPMPPAPDSPNRSPGGP